MPYAWRRGLIVDRNPLRGVQLQRLYALDPIEEHGHLPESMGKVDLPHARSLWLQHIAENDRAARAVLWDGLLAEPDSAGFFRILAWLEHNHSPLPTSMANWFSPQTRQLPAWNCGRSTQPQA